MNRSGRPVYGKTPPSEVQISPFLKMIGFAAANIVPLAIGNTAGAPLNRIGLILRTQAEQNLEKPITGIMDCTFRISNEEGPQSFWKGNLLWIMRYLPERIAEYLLRKYIYRTSRFFSYPRTKYGFGVWYLAGIVGGTASATLVTTVCYPMSFVHIYTADFGNKFTSMWDLYKKVIKNQGLLGLYCGMEVSLLGLAFHRMVYIGLAELVKVSMETFNWDSPLFVQLASYFIVVTAPLAAYPLDTIRYRMMMRCATQGKYSNGYQVAKQIIAEEGWMALWSGSIANMLKFMCALPVYHLYDHFTK